MNHDLLLSRAYERRTPEESFSEFAHRLPHTMRQAVAFHTLEHEAGTHGFHHWLAAGHGTFLPILLETIQAMPQSEASSEMGRILHRITQLLQFHKQPEQCDFTLDNADYFRIRPAFSVELRNHLEAESTPSPESRAWNQGFICACAILVKVDGWSTAAREVAGANGLTIDDLLDMQADYSDLQALGPHLTLNGQPLPLYPEDRPALTPLKEKLLRDFGAGLVPYREEYRALILSGHLTFDWENSNEKGLFLRRAPEQA